MGDIILDLSVYNDETADIRLKDGAVIHLRKPTEALVIELLQLRNIDAGSMSVELLDALNRVCGAILNNNADGVRFERDAVAALQLDMKTSIVQAYTDFATRLQSNPTISRPSNPETKRTGRRSLREWFTGWLSTRAAHSGKR